MLSLSGTQWRPIIVVLFVIAILVSLWTLGGGRGNAPHAPPPKSSPPPVAATPAPAPVARVPKAPSALKQPTPLELLQDTWDGIGNAAEKYCKENNCGGANNQWLTWGLGAMPIQVDYYYRLATLPLINTVCEVGFNAGHSVAVWLQANEKSYVYNFDFVEIPYQAATIDYLKGRFGSRFELIQGDSTVVVPKWADEHPNVKCDLISIDGGHSEAVAYADMKNFAKLAHVDTLVVLDDICRNCLGKAGGWTAGPTAAWDRAVSEKILRPVKRYDNDEWHRGWCVARFVSPQRSP